MVGHAALNRAIGVRIPASQPTFSWIGALLLRPPPSLAEAQGPAPFRRGVLCAPCRRPQKSGFRDARGRVAGAVGLRPSFHPGVPSAGSFWAFAPVPD